MNSVLFVCVLFFKKKKQKTFYFEFISGLENICKKYKAVPYTYHLASLNVHFLLLTTVLESKPGN